MTLWWIYLLIGPGAWAVFIYLMFVGRERMLKLLNSKAVVPADPPLVTILIPAKDEGEPIRQCLMRVLQQDYPNFEVIAVNDRSSDNTGVIMEEIAKQDSRVRVVHITELPEGWLGKCHALSQAAVHAKGTWLLFVDSDVELQPNALSKTVSLAIERSYDAVSILTQIQTEYFIEKIMLPMMAGTWASVFAADQTNEDSQPDRAVANGQFFLIRANAYAQVKGHEGVKDRIVEDVELMRLLKKNGFKTRLFAGRHLAATRMHTHLKQMFHGWARIFAGTSRGSVWPMVWTILFYVICVLSVYPAIAYAIISHNPNWLYAAVGHWVLMTFVFMTVHRWSGNSMRYALFLPISAPIFISILVFSIHRAITGQVSWRGSNIAIRKTAG